MFYASFKGRELWGFPKAKDRDQMCRMFRDTWKPLYRATARRLFPGAFRTGGMAVAPNGYHVYRFSHDND